MSSDSRIQNIKNCIESYPDFPKPGIIFRDVFPIFLNPSVSEDLVSVLCDYILKQVDGIGGVVGLEARGFVLGSLVAAKLHLPFVPIRKAGKLPGQLVKKAFQLEYGQAEFEVQTKAVAAGQKMIIVDDLLATGGTLEAAISLLETCGASVVHCLVVVELKDLNGRKKIKAPIHSIVEY